MSSPPDTIENHNRGDDRDNAASHDAVDDVGGDGGGVVVGDVREAGRSGCRARATSAGVGGGGGAAATPESVGDSAAMNETRRQFSYCAEALGVALKSIPTERKNLEEIEVAVKKTCSAHGVKLARESSRKERAEGGRLVMIAWRCVHGMPNRQAQHKESSSRPHAARRKYSSQRTGCDFKITARWPLRCPVNKHPRLTTMHLEHRHEVDKVAMNTLQERMRAPLSSQIEADAAKLTDAGLPPAMQTRVLKALHERRGSPRAVQSAAPRCSGEECLYDAEDLLKKDMDSRRERLNSEGLDRVEKDPMLTSKSSWETMAEGATIQPELTQMTDGGPTAQDHRILYVDMMEECTAAVAKGVGTLDPMTLRHIVATFVAQVDEAARIAGGTGVIVRNRQTVRVPAGKRLGNKRHKSRHPPPVTTVSSWSGENPKCSVPAL